MYTRTHWQTYRFQCRSEVEIMNILTVKKVNTGHLIFLISFLILVMLSLTLIVLNNHVTASEILEKKGNMSAPKIHTPCLERKVFSQTPILLNLKTV
jgi:hypothetical protein